MDSKDLLLSKKLAYRDEYYCPAVYLSIKPLTYFLAIRGPIVKNQSRLQLIGLTMMILGNFIV